jgi:serine/threonine-protein kinase RsbW
VATTPPLVLRFPAEPRYAGVARTAVAATAERLDLTVDRIEDLRLAVSELMALASATSAGAEVAVTIRTDSGLSIEAEFPATEPVAEDGFAWMVLRGLVGGAEQSLRDGRLRIILSFEAVAAGGSGAGAPR